MGEIESVSHEIVSLLKSVNPKHLEIIEGLQRCPYHFNPPELHEIAQNDSTVKKLLTHKKKLEKQLRYVERMIRATI